MPRKRRSSVGRVTPHARQQRLRRCAKKLASATATAATVASATSAATANSATSATVSVPTEAKESTAARFAHRSLDLVSADNLSEVGLPVKRFGPKPTLTGRQKEELTIAFGEFDPRGSGLIDSRSYIIALRAMGFEPKVEKVQAFIDETIGSCGKESLDFKEFHKLMAIKMLGDDRRTELNRMFREFSNDEAGGITLQHLTNVARELGEDISQDELVEMITFADADKDGLVSFEEFMKIMERPELE